MTVWVKIFHFLHGGRKFSPTETRERFEQQGENSFNESKKGAVGCFMKELIGKNKVQTISSRRGQNSNINHQNILFPHELGEYVNERSKGYSTALNIAVQREVHNVASALSHFSWTVSQAGSSITSSTLIGADADFL